MTTFTTSLIVLTYNCLRYTQACLHSIRQYTQTPYELIVVDNASSDGSVEFLQQQSDIHLIANPTNQGYSSGNNQGLKVAKGDFLIFLNNDVILTPNWLPLLIQHFQMNPQLGVLGPRTNQISGLQKIECNYHPWDIDAINQTARTRQLNYPQQLIEHPRVAGFCMMFSRKVYEAIGGLDERFGTGNYEDDDFCKRAIEAGFKVGIADNVFIHHFGSVSFLENKVDYQKLMRHNREAFLKKWGEGDSFYSSSRPEVLRLIPQQYQVILDIGCRSGKFGLALKERELGATVIGIEANPDTAQEAMKYLDQVLIGKIESLTLPFADAYFDCIVFNNCLEECFDPKAVIKKVLPFLKPSGLLLFSIANFRHYSVLKDLFQGQWHYHEAGLLNRQYLRFFTLNELDKILYNLNIEIDRCHSIELTPPDSDEIEHYQHFEDQLSHKGLFANGLATDMLVYQYFVIGGSQSHTLERKKRYEIDRLRIYWKESRPMDCIAWTGNYVSISKENTLDCNITVHVNQIDELSTRSGTLMNIARISASQSFNLETLERLKNMDDIWVIDLNNKMKLIEQGIAEEHIFVLPVLNDPKNANEWEQNISDRLLILCDQQRLLGSTLA